MKKAGQEKAVPFVDLAVPTEQVRARYVAAVDRLLAGHNFILTRAGPTRCIWHSARWTWARGTR
jgi:hypothetical protein